jgi:O-succinylhomoserine sulfhydrylase
MSEVSDRDGAGLPQGVGPGTLAVRAGQVRTPEGEHNDPIFLTSSFVFSSAEQAAARFAETEPGNVYSRFTNPTVRAFEERLAAMEGAEHAVATASGMGATLSLCMAHLEAGDHVVAAESLFGSTVSLFANLLPRFGIEVSFVPVTDLQCWREAIRPQTRLLFLESPTNPLGELADIEALSAIAHASGALLAVDNCVLTPALQRPLELGADVVVHSATKYLDGQGRCVGGALVTNDTTLRDAVFAFLRTGGPCLSPFNAWVFLNGLETLALRMRAHTRSAQGVAEWLQRRDGVRRVFYPGLQDHPQHALASRQQLGFGGIVSFEIEGGREQAFAFINACRWISITGNFGDAKSTITHPASTTHGRLDDEQRRRAGIGEGLLRLSVGLEDAADIIDEMERGLRAAGLQAPRRGLRTVAG